VYLGADEDAALKKYHRLALGQPMVPVTKSSDSPSITVKELANRFLDAQQANWRNPQATLRSYTSWLRRFLLDHPRLRAEAFTVEMFASWKLSLRTRGYSQESINHYLSAVRALYRFAEDTDILVKVPRLRRIRNETSAGQASNGKTVYTADQIAKLLKHADYQLRVMILLGLNCGFGPKDLEDLTWENIDENRITLPRNKTGVSQTFLLWPETKNALGNLREHRARLKERLAKRGPKRSDGGKVFVTRFWRPWNKDAVAEQFRKLCKKANIPCHGFYRLRHSASTAMSLVANPHVQRKFMRHSQLQQQVTYTHTPDSEVDAALVETRRKLLSDVNEDQGSDQESGDVV
jgi:integrase